MDEYVLGVAIPLTVVSIVSLCLLSAALVIARVRRDRREARQARRRDHLGHAFAHGDDAVLRAAALAAVGHRETRIDLVDTARRTPAEVLRPHAPRALVDVAIADTHHRHAEHRALGAELVALIGRADDLTHVARVLHDDPDRQARRVAARALSRRGDETSARHLVDGLVRASLPGDRLVEQLSYPFAVPAMIDALSRAESVDARGDLIAALGLSGGQSAMFVVARFVRDGGDDERLRACRALGRLGCVQAVPLLLYAMGDASHTVRAMAARSLGELGDARAARVLEASLRDTDWWVRANAAASLAQLGHAGVAGLRRALDSGDRYARDRAAEALTLMDAARHVQVA